MIENFVFQLLSAGWNGLVDYLSYHVLFCLVPAFFLAGAVNALIPSGSILKYMGKKANPWVSYSIAAISGLLIEVCSCTILPLFAGIWKKGAGLGPAITFLFAGPAINLLAIVYTGSLIGWDLAIARTVFAMSFAVIIGLIMSKVFKDERKEKDHFIVSDHELEKPKHQVLSFFVLLAVILVIGTAPIDLTMKVISTIILTIILAIVTKLYYSKDEVKAWMKETYSFFKMIFPWLIVGVFFAGMLKVIIPQELFIQYMGSNTVLANLIGVLFGVFAYFPALVEVPIAKTFLDLGMAKGPLLAYLIADPVMSLQTILVIRRVLKNKKTFVYVTLITVLSVLIGLLFGMFAR